ncbi:uncharacterized protein LOC106092657 [Stomoxys calcitrans]|uniref:uncharacterized protein LOC106092657 n=1 Tax=Stomoxys calcitrans TaxID=35570 RepID=UPI0027E34A08|nr:uncharacterized protein LOC106092657 [Stomoxys calcitrans]
MSYEIKSTPHFRRMLTKSKKNGEYEKLREEYERIMEFDEKAVERRLRQVRLQRLFKEIEDIRVADEKRKCQEAQEKQAKKKLITNLIRAKEVGQYYSRLNGLGENALRSREPFPTSHGRVDILNKQEWRKQQRERHEHLKAQVNRRNNYGNEISNWNMQNMLMGKLSNQLKEGINQKAFKREVNSCRSRHSRDLQSSSESSFDGKARLLQRINYGNAISHMNIQQKMLKQRRKSDAGPNNEKEMQPLNLETNKISARGQTFIDSLSMDRQSHQDPMDQQNFMASNNAFLQSSGHVEALKQNLSAQKQWRKLKILIKFCFIKTKYPHNPMGLEPSPSTSKAIQMVIDEKDMMDNISKSNSFEDLSAHTLDLDQSPSLETLCNHPWDDVKENDMVENISRSKNSTEDLPSHTLGLSQAASPPLLDQPLLMQNDFGTLIKEQKINKLQQHSMNIHALCQIFEHKNY